jgi:Nucleoside-diphosphate-sugar epimerases
VRAASRQTHPAIEGVDFAIIPDLGSDANRSEALQGAETVIHLAARVHVMRESAGDPLAEFRRVNTSGTQTLARQAARAGVRRFVYLSSIKVNGEETRPGRPFTEYDQPAPMDPYGVSKCEAEVALRDVARETGMEVVIVRPPLVYGPGVRANFRRLMQLLCRGVPLPLGAIHNRRSLVGLDNLVDLIVTCLRHPAAADQTFLAGDGEDLSTTQLLRRLAQALGFQARLVPVPATILRLAFTMLNQRGAGQRLCGSLQVDISKAREVLNWKPPLSVDEALRRVAIDFLGSHSGTHLSEPLAIA